MDSTGRIVSRTTRASPRSGGAAAGHDRGRVCGGVCGEAVVYGMPELRLWGFVRDGGEGGVRGPAVLPVPLHPVSTSATAADRGAGIPSGRTYQPDRQFARMCRKNRRISTRRHGSASSFTCSTVNVPVQFSMLAEQFK